MGIEFDKGAVYVGKPRLFTLGQGIEGSIRFGSEESTPISAYLTQDGLVIEDTTPLSYEQLSEYIIHQDATSVTMLVHTKTNPQKLTIKLQYRIVQLANKALETHEMLFAAAASANNKRNTVFFSQGASCLLIDTIQFNQPVFKIDLSRHSPFKSLDDYDKHRQSDLGKKILSMERGVWSGINWSNIKAVGYQGRVYHTGAVEYQGRIYLADFKDAKPNPPVFTNCSAYNDIAIQDINHLLPSINPASLGSNTIQSDVP